MEVIVNAMESRKSVRIDVDFVYWISILLNSHVEVSTLISAFEFQCVFCATLLDVELLRGWLYQLMVDKGSFRRVDLLLFFYFLIVFRHLGHVLRAELLGTVERVVS